MPEEVVDQSGAEDATRKALEADGAADHAETDPKSYSPEYVRDLRNEAAKWRVQAQQFKQPWEAVTDDDRKVWERLIKLTASDPAAGAAYMEELAGHLKKATAPVTPPAPGQEQAPWNEQDISRMVDQRVADAETRRVVQEIEREAERLGYKSGTQDYVDLLWVAEHETNTDLEAAHKSIQERRGAWVDAELKRRQEASQGWPHVTRGGSAPAGGSTTIKDFGSAKASLMARLDSM